MILSWDLVVQIWMGRGVGKGGRREGGGREGGSEEGRGGRGEGGGGRRGGGGGWGGKTGGRAELGGERERAGVPIDGGVVACEPGKPQDHLEVRELDHVEGNVL